jgi:hypothetical protein
MSDTSRCDVSKQRVRELDEQITALGHCIDVLPSEMHGPQLALKEKLSAEREGLRVKLRSERPVAQRKAELDAQLAALRAKVATNKAKAEAAAQELERFQGYVASQTAREAVLVQQLRDLAVREAAELGPKAPKDNQQAELERRLAVAQAELDAFKASSAKVSVPPGTEHCIPAGAATVHLPHQDGGGTRQNLLQGIQEEGAQGARRASEVERRTRSASPGRGRASR